MWNMIDQSALALFDLAPDTVEKMWQTPLLGMGMIFAVLGLLWVILAIFGRVFGVKTKPKSAAPKKEAPAPATVSAAPAPATVSAAPAVSVPQSSDAELVAIITAAVAAYMSAEEGREVSDSSFRVVSFKRVRTGRAWNVR